MRHSERVWPIWALGISVILILAAASYQRGAGGPARGAVQPQAGPVRAATGPGDPNYPVWGETVQLYFYETPPPIPTLLPWQGYPTRAALITWVWVDTAPIRTEITMFTPQQGEQYFSRVANCNDALEQPCWYPLPNWTGAAAAGSPPTPVITATNTVPPKAVPRQPPPTAPPTPTIIYLPPPTVIVLTPSPAADNRGRGP